MVTPDFAWRSSLGGLQRRHAMMAVAAYLVTLALLIAVTRLALPGFAPFGGRLGPPMFAIGVLLAGALAWRFAGRNPDAARQTATGDAAPPLSDAARASVAVLPLECLSRGEDDDLLAKGFSAEIIRALAGVPDLRIVPHMQSAMYAGRTWLDVARALDVRYVMSGSLQRTAERLRVIVTLADASNGRQVWSESYEKDIGDVFQVQREVAEAIAIETGSRSLSIITEDLRRQPPKGLSAWSLTYKAITFWTVNYTPAASSEAIGWLERAIRLEPGNATAHVMLAFVLNQRVINHFSSNPAGENGRALAEVDTALRLAPRDSTVMEYAALVWLNCGFRNRCLQTARRVVAIAPFNMVAWGYVGCSLAWGGSPTEIDEGVTVLERLIKVAPNHPSLPYWHFFLSCANAERGNFPAARDHAQTAIDFHPGFSLGWVNLANALGELGDAAGARRALDRAREANPLFNIDNHQRYCHAISRETPDTPVHQTSGLVRAGLLRPWAAVVGG